MADSSSRPVIHDGKVQMMVQGLGVEDDDDDAPVPCGKVQMMAQGLGVEDDDADQEANDNHHRRMQNMGRSPWQLV